MVNHSPKFSARLFYSYCHEDLRHKKAMEKALALLRRENLLSDWSDQKILPGKRISVTVRNKMKQTDIFVFLLSQHFIASDECIKEWNWAKSQATTKQLIFRIPIILEPCAWLVLLDGDDILALPPDGTAVSTYDDEAAAWHQVYEGIKSVIDELRKHFTPRETYLAEVQQTEFLSHDQIRLKDIYTFPRLSCFTPKAAGVQLSDATITHERQLLEKPFVLIHGSEMSGKTAISRHLFLYLLDQSLPVLSVDLNQVSGKPKERIFQEFYSRQFHGDYELWKLQTNKTLILDNLSEAGPLVDFIVFAKNHFERIIVTVSSDTFISFFRDDARLADFYEMKIEPLTHSQQEHLIRRRLALRSSGEPVLDGTVDKIEDRVNSIIISNKIVPRYPFYVLSILQTYEAFMPENLAMSSFGHCYHALIVAKLIKAGISESDSDINACFNFAEKLAYSIYLSNSRAETRDATHFTEFLKEYRESYIITQSTLSRLKNSRYGLLSREGGFRAPYIYFFFLGRYFAKSQAEHEEQIGKLCEESHVATSRLILLFIIHHTNDHKIIDDILLRTMCSIEGVEPAVLDRKESGRFFKVLASIPNNILSEDSVEAQRRSERDRRDMADSEVSELEEEELQEEKDDVNEIYRVLKSNQILGQILRNKYGSLERVKIEEVVETIVDGGLRLVNVVLKDDKEIEQLALYVREKHPQYKKKQIERALRHLSFVWTMINVENAVHAINVPEIREVVMKVVDRRATPAYDLIGYFNHLDATNELSEETVEELDALLKKHKNPFIQNVLSLRTQHYMNTHASKTRVEQRVCSLLKVKYVHKGSRR